MEYPQRAKVLWQFLTDQLSAIYSSEEAKTQAYWVLEHFFDLSLTKVLLDTSLENADFSPLDKVMPRLLDHEPIQYVLGHTWFCGHQFYVNSAVLIPRPETEELVQLALTSLPDTPITVLDIGTGSGCIPISLGMARPTWNITGLDVSAEALEVAKQNGTRLGANVQWVQQDVLTEIPPVSSLDLLISNPPYVRVSEMEAMASNVLDFEPHRALFVNDNAPLLFYQRIGFLGTQLIKPGGTLMMEINEALGRETGLLFEELGYHDIKVLPDMQGKDRMVSAFWPGR